MMSVLIKRSKCWWWYCWSKGQDAEDVVADQKKEEVKVLKMLLIERSKCWRCCCWSKSQSAEYVADWKVKMLKMLLLIDQSKYWRCCWSKGPNAEDVVADWKIKMLKMLLLIEQSKYWRCCWSKGSSAEDVVADWKIKILKMLLIKAVKELMMMNTEDWRWRLHDVEKLPMIYRCVTLLMLMMSSISTHVVVDVEYPSC